MHIIYAATVCSDHIYRMLYENVAKKPAVQSQKYHRLLIEGLAANTHVDVVANPPVNKNVLQRSVVKLPEERDKGVIYHHIPAIRNPLLKTICVATGTFFKTLRYAKKDSAVVIDCLNRVAGAAALVAARIRKIPCVGIVTDLPEMLLGGTVSKKLSAYLIRNCTHYIFLTEAMNMRLNPSGKPYVILEGHSDIQMKNVDMLNVQKSRPRICLYAGCISKQFGIQHLIEGFRKAKLDNVQLHLYGPIGGEEEFRELISWDDSVYYGGMLLSSEVVQKEMEATLLVNPRPTHEEFVKYSFPSKTMEYMASGTPVLTTVLPGMPKDYYPHVFLLEQETAEGIADKLTEVLSLSDEELFEKGKAAKEFILDTRNNVVQAAKILEMLNK